MADGYIVNDKILYNIADAIRNKNGESTLYRPQDMADAILSIGAINLTPELIQVLNKTITTLDDSIDRKITNIGRYACYSCSQLSSINLPVCISVGYSAFNRCSNLSSINLSACTSIGNYAFQNCALLTTVNLPACTSIETGAFQNCTSLTSIILSGSTVCSLGNISAFSDTPIESGTGYIYVPANLVDTYKAATNWSTYSSRIVTG